MITRRPFGRFVQLPVILAAAFGLLTVSCEKVPLLAPSSASITLTASATALPINGTTDLIAQVLEQAGTPPHSGTHVIFTTTLGSVQPSEAETDLNGRVVVKFLAGTASGTATIVASSGGAGSSGATTGTGATATTTDSRTVKIAIGAAAVGRIALTANPGTVPSSGGNSTIVASIGDGNGNVLANVPVTFTTDAGSLSASIVNTDQNGNAQTILTTNKTAKVTAAAGLSASGSGTTTTGIAPATVTVNVNAASTVTVGTPSPAAPVVGQPVTFGLTYTQSANGSPVQRVIVDFGDGSPAQTFTGAPSAVSHTYSAPGSYTVRVTAIDTFGDAASGVGTVTVTPRPTPLVTLTATPNPSTMAQQPVTFTATPSTGIQVDHYEFNFGDTSPTRSTTGNSTTHAFLAPGNYVVTVIMVTADGNRGSTSIEVRVTL